MKLSLEIRKQIRKLLNCVSNKVLLDIEDAEKFFDQFYYKYSTSINRVDY